ncbi:MAG: hypothetical protein AAFN40_18220, partial [Cyanobacteria bacterium J06560_6]
MSTAPPTPTKYRLEAIDTAVERVVAFGRQQLVDSPEQVLDIVGRQARQLLAQQTELAQYKQQLQALESEVAALQSAQFVGSVAPFRIDEKKRSQKPKKPGRKPGHRGAWRQSPPPSEHDEHIEVPLRLCPDCGHDLDIGNQRAIEQTCFITILP